MSGLGRSGLGAWLVAAWVGCVPAGARAHDHEPPTTSSAAGVSVRATVTPELGRYANLAARGDFQGVALRAELSSPWVSAWVGAGVYRVFRVIDARVGTSDLAFGLSSTLALGEVLTLIPSFSVSLPTGADGLQLGMGHAMLMPGAAARLSFEGWSLGARVSYCHGLDTDGHEHLPPIVAPMFLREVEGGLSARVGLGQRFGVWGELSAARSLIDERARLAPRVGADAALGPVMFGLWAALPGPGLPYDWRVGSTVSVALPSAER
jgi:hypothetical protein